MKKPKVRSSLTGLGINEKPTKHPSPGLMVEGKGTFVGIATKSYHLCEKQNTGFHCDKW